MLNLIQQAELWQQQGQWQQAVRLYQQALAEGADNFRHVYLFNLGVILSQHEQHAQAEEAYRQAIFTKPDFVQAWFNLGAVVERSGRKAHAVTIWKSMVDHPLVGRKQEVDMYIMVLNSLGRVQEELREFEDAESWLLESLLTRPDQPKVIQHWVHLRQKQCKWPLYEVPQGTDAGELVKWTSPLAMLSASDDPGLQLATAMRFVNDKVDMRMPVLCRTPHKPHARLRLGFMSSDFCLHAVSLLTVELLELIDRERFEVFGFCWSREDGSALRRRVVNALDHHIQIGAMSDEEAARCIFSHEIDVLIDLQGITSGARPNILSWRPAPIQMTYLGFPGTTGHPCIDYVIADRYLIPESSKPFYSEKPFYMPHVFQCSDRQRPIGRTPKRSDHGLPEDKFIYCSFNNNYKFTPEMYSAWMRILQAVPDSVFWLLEDNPWSRRSLLAHAQAHGVAADRLIFAGRVAPEDYLARYQLADLFLDAYPFNGGTTANDALWMRLPVLTRSGRVFASRMAGSLLNALDMPELITEDLASYETRAIALGLDRKRYKAMKARLVRHAKHSPLFDMPRFVNDFQDGLAALDQAHRLAPST